MFGESVTHIKFGFSTSNNSKYCSYLIKYFEHFLKKCVFNDQLKYLMVTWILNTLYIKLLIPIVDEVVYRPIFIFL